LRAGIAIETALEVLGCLYERIPRFVLIGVRGLCNGEYLVMIETVDGTYDFSVQLLQFTKLRFLETTEIRHFPWRKLPRHLKVGRHC
jgi:hypothetical protein